jgi:hypothetical protein
MEQLNGAVFGSYSMLISTRTKWELDQQQGRFGYEDYPSETHALLRSAAALLATEFQKVSLLVFAKAAFELVAEIDGTVTLGNGVRRFTGQNLSSALGHLRVLAEFLGREMENRYLLVMDPVKVMYYQQPTLFGAMVFDKFPSANNDIFEAGMCLALERGTACVMHLMRVMEVGLKGLATAVGVGVQNDWGAYLREIEKEMTAQYKASGARTQKERFYAEAVLMFHLVKRVWRNPTMHVENSYSFDRAEEILRAVRSFMVHLAENVSE